MQHDTCSQLLHLVSRLLLNLTNHMLHLVSVLLHQSSLCKTVKYNDPHIILRF